MLYPQSYGETKQMLTFYGFKRLHPSVGHVLADYQIRLAHNPRTVCHKTLPTGNKNYRRCLIVVLVRIFKIIIYFKLKNDNQTCNLFFP